MISSIFQVCQDQISWEAQTNFQCFNQILFGDGVHHSGKLLCRTHLRRHQSGEIKKKRGIQKNSPIWVMCFLVSFQKISIKFLMFVPNIYQLFPHAFVLSFPPFPKFNWVGVIGFPPKNWQVYSTRLSTKNGLLQIHGPPKSFGKSQWFLGRKIRTNMGSIGI